MSFACKIIDKNTKRYIDKHFYNYNAIKKGIALAKLEKEDAGAAIGNIGYSPPDPTGNKAIKNVSEITQISVLTVWGDEFTVYMPERWLRIMDQCFDHYNGELVGDMVKARYFSRQAPEATAGILSIAPSTYYEWLDAFLYDAATLAIAGRLINPTFKENLF